MPYLTVTAGWGSPPTPLLPRWYLEALSTRPIPEQLHADGALSTVGELGRFWECRSNPLDNGEIRALLDLVGPLRPPSDQVVIPPGVDHAVLPQWPLRPRTSNGLRRVGLDIGTEAITVGDLLPIHQFGTASLIDLMCVAETAFEILPYPPQSGEGERTEDTSSRSIDYSPRAITWSALIGPLETLFAVAGEFRGATTVAEALSTDLEQLARTIGIEPALAAFKIQDLTPDRRLADNLHKVIEDTVRHLSPVEISILEERLYCDDPKTLEQLGKQWEITRERVRQIQVRLQKRIRAEIGPLARVISALVGQELGPIIAEGSLEDCIRELLPNSTLGRRILREHLGYSCESGLCLDGPGVKVAESLVKTARGLADDVGVFEETALRECLPNQDWAEHWEALIERCDLHRLSAGYLSLRATVRARVKAAILTLGEPVTREQIASLCNIGPDRLGATLTAIPGVARADKTRWGLTEWIDDEYQGIPAEIIQRIQEDGGAVSLKRLLSELPALFGVSEVSVRAYVGTPQFVLKDGYVSMADESSLILRSLDDVIDGRDATGAPYWRLAVEDRYLEGYSALGFPPELAVLLECEPNDSIRVKVAQPEGCQDLSVVWRLSAINGPSLGYLAEPLRKLDVVGGESVRVVIKGPGVVELQRDIGSESSDPSAGTLLERMKNRRKVL